MFITEYIGFYGYREEKWFPTLQDAQRYVALFPNRRIVIRERKGLSLTKKNWYGTITHKALKLSELRTFYANHCA